MLGPTGATTGRACVAGWPARRVAPGSGMRVSDRRRGRSGRNPSVQAHTRRQNHNPEQSDGAPFDAAIRLGIDGPSPGLAGSAPVAKRFPTNSVVVHRPPELRYRMSKGTISDLTPIFGTFPLFPSFIHRFCGNRVDKADSSCGNPGHGLISDTRSCMCPPLNTFAQPGRNTDSS